ncbi:MAG: type II toxin-antitoxin system HicA family toxin [Oscillospiraceae bacterium]|jgi:predicted RNA binding protein YcfA (HicA-like mRNA interferase family)|nr:type II toxin-antitoxin system HicA family toxin [Oscillospiraceae bacterium]
MPSSSKEVLRMLRDDGWYEVGSEGSHVQLKHPAKLGKVTVPLHREIKPGTLNSIKKQAGLK